MVLNMRSALQGTYLEKLTIEAETAPGRFSEYMKVPFNPNSISIRNGTKWKSVQKRRRDNPEKDFVSGDDTTLSFELHFNGYDDGTSVLPDTQKIETLMLIEGHGNLHRPPICKLQWGQGLKFQGVLSSLNQTFTLFLPNGEPARAKLDCTFTEWISDEESQKRANLESPDVHKVHIVRRGDTLSAISYQYYDSVHFWRLIARHNQIDNPLLLTPGTTLILPKVTG